MKKIYLLALLSISCEAGANGFSMPEQNVTNLGLAYAGTGSQASDASSAYYNPAGLTRMKNRQFIAGAVYTDPDTVLNVSIARGPGGGLSTPSSGTDKPKGRVVVPSLHYAAPINNKFTFGASLVSTFGSTNNYPSSAVSRYMATKSEMMTVDLAPSFGYKCNDQLSLGAGLDLYHAKVALNSAINVTGGASTATDGFIKNKGKANQLGMHAGLLYEVDPSTRFGFKYNSRVLLNFKGYSELQSTNGGAVTTQNVQAKLDLPESFTVSGYHGLNDQWAIMSDLQWLHWSRLKNVVLNYANGSKTIFNYYYKNSYRFAVGGTYDYNDKLQLKLGTSFDSTPTTTAWRATNVPDGNQTGLAVGARYNLSRKLVLDAGLAHVFSNRVTINQSAPTILNSGNPQPLNSITSKSKQHINAVGLQLTFNMV